MGFLIASFNKYPLRTKARLISELWDRDQFWPPWFGLNFVLPSFDMKICALVSARGGSTQSVLIARRRFTCWEFLTFFFLLYIYIYYLEWTKNKKKEKFLNLLHLGRTRFSHYYLFQMIEMAARRHSRDYKYYVNSYERAMAERWNNARPCHNFVTCVVICWKYYQPGYWLINRASGYESVSDWRICTTLGCFAYVRVKNPEDVSFLAHNSIADTVFC